MTSRDAAQLRAAHDIAYVPVPEVNPANDCILSHEAG